ncbi:MAG TPA: hypothetical protein VKJ45_08740 [Blastocatellia bacterium]|nr:hypothetical protein [Blastocatellia bacterium]
MKRMFIALGLIAFCSLSGVACFSGGKHLSFGETGVIKTKDPVFGTRDRESYERYTKALQTADKVEQVQLLVRGDLVKLVPGTKLKVIGTYDYMGTHAYKAEMIETLGQGGDVGRDVRHVRYDESGDEGGDDGFDSSFKMSFFVNAYYVDAVK